MPLQIRATRVRGWNLSLRNVTPLVTSAAADWDWDWANAVTYRIPLYDEIQQAAILVVKMRRSALYRAFFFIRKVNALQMPLFTFHPCPCVLCPPLETQSRSNTNKLIKVKKTSGDGTWVLQLCYTQTSDKREGSTNLKFYHVISFTYRTSELSVWWKSTPKRGRVFIWLTVKLTSHRRLFCFFLLNLYKLWLWSILINLFVCLLVYKQIILHQNGYTCLLNTNWAWYSQEGTNKQVNK